VRLAWRGGGGWGGEGVAQWEGEGRQHDSRCAAERRGGCGNSNAGGGARIKCGLRLSVDDVSL
jgi:hypothetical protein